MALIITPASGLFSGGAAVRLEAAELDVSASQYDFSSGDLAPLFTNVSVSGAVVVPDDKRQVLIFETGSSSGGAAIIRTVASAGDFDLTFAMRLVSQALIRATTTLARLDFGSLNVAVVQGPDGAFFVTPSTRYQLPRIFRDAEVSIRAMRADRRLFFFCGDAQETFEFDNVTRQFDISARADPAIAGSLRTYLTAYYRRPLVRFGDVPITDVRIAGEALCFGTMPAVSPGLDTVDAAVTGTATSPVITADAFTFTRPADLLRFRSKLGTLTAVGDKILTQRGKIG